MKYFVLFDTQCPTYFFKGSNQFYVFLLLFTYFRHREKLKQTIKKYKYHKKYQRITLTHADKKNVF